MTNEVEIDATQPETGDSAEALSAAPSVNSIGALVRRLWSLCNVLRDDGISYQSYITELTYLLFLKLAEERGTENSLPKGCRWEALIKAPAGQALDYYRRVLTQMAASPIEEMAEILLDASTSIRTDSSLLRLVNGIDSLDWFGVTDNGMGDVYEGLIEKSAQESRYGAGQYFTPRSLVDAMVGVCRPNPQDRVYDPAAGTAGFLVSAGRYSLNRNPSQPDLVGNELVPEVRRMSLMNLNLHHLKARVHVRDTLSVDPSANHSSICLANPPFGVKSGLSPNQSQFLDYPTSNKQLAFLQHIYKSLDVGGRAAVVVPENVLFENGVGADVRTHILNNYDLHTILLLPSGIFYATGVKTAVLFFARTHPTAKTWIYNLRSHEANFTKRRQLSAHHLKDFVRAYGTDPLGGGSRRPSGHFRAYSREELRAGKDRLDLDYGDQRKEPLDSPSALLGIITSELEGAVEAAREMRELLGGNSS